MTQGILSTPKSLIDLIPKSESIGIGSMPLNDGAHLRYVIVPQEPANYAILTRDEGKGRVQHYVVSKTTFDRVAEEKPELTKAEDLEAFGSASDREESPGRDAGNDALKEKLRDHDPATENSLQTEQEASLQTNNVALVEKVRDLYKADAWADFMKAKGATELVSVVKVPDLQEDGTVKQRLVLATTYMPIVDCLIPEVTIFDDDFIFICSREYVKAEIVKDFFYQNVMKSTKISAGLSFSLASGSASIGPKLNDPVFANGGPAKSGESGSSPDVGGSGPKLQFSGEMIKQYAKLTLKAGMRQVYEIGSYKVLAMPRKRKP